MSCNSSCCAKPTKLTCYYSTMKKNTAKVWDSIWTDSGLNKNDLVTLEAEAATKRWLVLKQILLAELNTLKNKKVLEIGSGIGTYAALIAKEGAKATVLDYSTQALSRAGEFFKANDLPLKIVKADALRLPKRLYSAYDVAISIGLTEHFNGKQRLLINRVHLDALKPGGIAVIAVPNAYNPPYRIFKFLKETTGRWEFGEEHPYTKKELLQLVNKLGAEKVALFGDDFYSSLKFLLPANFLRRFFKVGSPNNLSDLRQERGTPIDDYLGYSLTLVMRKPQN